MHKHNHHIGGPGGNRGGLLDISPIMNKSVSCFDPIVMPLASDASFNKAVRGVLFGLDHQDVNSGRVASL